MKSVLTCLLSLLFFSSFAQKVNLLQGNLDFLKGEKMIDVQFDFNTMTIGRYPSEEKYVKEKVKTCDKSLYHNGDEWLAQWKNGISEKYPAKFVQLFNESLAEKGVSVDTGQITSRYRLTVKTISLDPGYDVAIASSHAIISVQYIFTDINDNNKVLAVLSASKIPGEISDGFSTSFKRRVANAYGNAAWVLSSYLIRKVL